MKDASASARVEYGAGTLWPSGGELPADVETPTDPRPDQSKRKEERSHDRTE